jgi:hypothetical protein
MLVWKENYVQQKHLFTDDSSCDGVILDNSLLSYSASEKLITDECTHKL